MPQPLLPVLQLNGPWIKDDKHRILQLRGVNLSGSAKQPRYPHIPSQTIEEFYETADTARFIDRPFSLKEADQHLERLREWGYNILRYVVCWEAMEHQGPGKYDDEFIDFTIQILKKCRDYGFRVFIDPHQDVWSRFASGSGAPFWTFIAAGLNPIKFPQTCAAIVHNAYPDPDHPAPEQFPKMIWSTNYHRLAVQTMFTLFYAGKVYAPKCIIDGVNIQEYLQSHFIACYVRLAKAIHQVEGLEDALVIGYDTMNEPSPGYVNTPDITKIPEAQVNKRGPTPTALQGMQMGTGLACDVENWDVGQMGPYKHGSVNIDPRGVSAWLPADYDDSRYGWKRGTDLRLGECLWAQHGVWDPKDTSKVNNDYFALKMPVKRSKVTVQEASESFQTLHWKPFVRRFIREIRSLHKTAIVLVQPPVNEVPPRWDEPEDAQDRIIYGPHYYDGLTLITKKWNWFNVDLIGLLRGKYLSPVFAVKVGENAIRKSFVEQLAYLKKEGEEVFGNHPFLISEIGIPYDMGDKLAFETGDYSSQIRAMDANCNALDRNMINFTLWNYCPDNIHEWGDQWNGEDLSLFSTDDEKNLANATLKSIITMTHDPMEYPKRSSLAQANAIPTRNDSQPSPAHSLSSAATLLDDDQKNKVRQAMKVQPTLQPSASFTSTVFDRTKPVRAQEAFIRPYAIATFGIPLTMEFTLKPEPVFKFSFRDYKEDESAGVKEPAPTELYIPSFHFGIDGGKVWVSDGEFTYDHTTQVLKWSPDPTQVVETHEIVVQTPNPEAVDDLPPQAEAEGLRECPSCSIM